MITTCTVVLMLVRCVVAQGEKLTPTEAARILLPHQYVYVPRRSFGPTVSVAAYTEPVHYPIPPTYPLTTPFYMSTYTGPTIGVVHLGSRSAVRDGDK